jgi:hypothetical protein
MGMIQRTPRGRIVTENAKKHLGLWFLSFKPLLKAQKFFIMIVHKLTAME